MLTVNQASVYFEARGGGYVHALDRVSLEIPEDGFVVALGTSGCGKSTLLKAIAGFLQPVEGRITLKDRVIDGPGPDRMMVFQEFDQLLPWKTVRANVAYPMLVNGIGRDEAQSRALDALAKVNLSKFADAYPHMLSGGMKQKLSLVAALVAQPQILLLDEPTALLDETSQREVLQLIHALSRRPEQPITAIWITHRLEELDWCDGAALMQNGRIGAWRSGANLQQQLRPLAHGQG